MVLPAVALDVESILSLDPIDDPYSLNWPKRFIARELGWIPTFDYERTDPHGLYGGQVIAQTVWAACHTVPALFDVHSTHGYFLRPGNSSERIVYNVYEVRTGRGYATRRIEALQFDKVIYTCFANFKLGISTRLESKDKHIRHATPCPTDALVPRYEDIPKLPVMPDIDMPGLRDFKSLWEMPIRFHELIVASTNKALPTHLRRQLRYFKSRYRITNTSHNFQAVYLMYASDRNFLFGSTNAHEVVRDLRHEHVASLDHSFIVHASLGTPSDLSNPVSSTDAEIRQVRVLEAEEEEEDGKGVPGWVTFESKSPNAGDARSLTTGYMWDRNGRHLASVMQDAFCEVRDEGPLKSEERPSQPTSKL